MPYAFFNVKEPGKMVVQAINVLSFSMSLYQCLMKHPDDVNHGEEGINMAVCALNFFAAGNAHGAPLSLGLVFLNTFRAGSAFREMNAKHPDISQGAAVLNMINSLSSIAGELAPQSPVAHR